MTEIHLTHFTDTGHRVVGHENGKGKCARLHGHTYRYEVTVASPILLPIGFIVDFATIKEILDEWDHRTLLWEMDPVRVFHGHELSSGSNVEKNAEWDWIMRVPFNPTAENMATNRAGAIYGSVLRQHAEHGYGGEEISVEIELFETPKSSAKVKIQ